MAHRRTGNVDGLAKQNNPKPARQTRATSQKKVDCIALWHFDKSLLEHLSRNGNATGVPKSIDKEAATKHVFFGSRDCCYSNADVHCQTLNGSNKKNPVVKTSIVALVPTFYNTSEAFSDIAKATPTFEAYEQVQKVKKKADKRISNRSNVVVSSSSSGSDLDLSPPSKRKSNGGHVSGIVNNKKRKGPVLEMNDVEAIVKLKRQDQRKYLNKLNESIDEYKAWTKKEMNKWQDLVQDSSEYERLLGEAIIREEHLKRKDDAALKKMKEKEETTIAKDDVLEKLRSAGGLNRISLVSKKGICTDANICRQLYGFQDFEFCIDFLETVFEIEYKEPTQSTVRAGRNGSLSEVEQCLLTLIYTNTRWSYDIIGLMFGVNSVQTVGEYIIKWMPLLGERGDMMSSFLTLMDEESYEELEPKSYKEVDLRKVGALVDGKDFLTETVRVDRVLNCALARNKMHASAFRLLTWSLPCGAVLERTPAFLGRASEKSLMNIWGSLRRKDYPLLTRSYL